MKMLLAVTILTALPGGSGSRAAFDELKKLEGTWESPDKDHPMKVTFRASAGGSVLMETMVFPGHPEMITMYHLDGDDLVLTHYCKLGNQPRMRAGKDPKPGVVRFSYDGGTNLKPEDRHMHSLVVTLKDPDHLLEEWTLYNEGKKETDVTISLVRKKD